MLPSLEEKMKHIEKERRREGGGMCKTNTLTVSRKNYLGFGEGWCLPALLLFLLGLGWRTVQAGRVLRGKGVKQAVPSDYTWPKGIRNSHTRQGQAWQHL